MKKQIMSTRLHLPIKKVRTFQKSAAASTEPNRLTQLSKRLVPVLQGVLMLAFFALILTLSLRGLPGNPSKSTLNTLTWKDNGPFELSPDRGRFALTVSIVEDHSVFFSLPIARFATPDTGYKNGHYVSLFAPGVSYIIIPGYLIGKIFNLAQVGSFAVIALFALANALLIYLITRKFHVHPMASFLSSITFLFATPAFAYGVSLYQHHISTFLILLSMYLLLKYKSVKSLTAIWFLIALSIPVDYPNLFLMLPIGFYALGRLITIKRTKQVSQLNIKLLGIFTFVGVVLPLLFFMWFNNASYGNPLQFSGTITQAKEISNAGLPVVPKKITKDNINATLTKDTGKKSALTFFKPRNLINGLYTHLFSPDRGILIFTPVVLLALFGIVMLYKTSPQITAVLGGVILFDLILYSMWGDPWGGWAFGSRYMIPSYAVLALFVGVAISRLRKNLIFMSLFFIILAYSTAVNTLGALTTNQNPPKAEVLELEKLSHTQERYSYDRNYQYIKDDRSKSYIWQEFGKKYLSAESYLRMLILLILIPSLFATIVLIFSKRKEAYEI